MSEHMMKLVEDMWEELEGAKHYAEMAVANKGIDGIKTGVYGDMAKQELTHFENLHKLAVQELNSHKGEEHHAAQMVWDWEHGKMMRRAAKIRAMLDMAK